MRYQNIAFDYSFVRRSKEMDFEFDSRVADSLESYSFFNRPYVHINEHEWHEEE